MPARFVAPPEGWVALSIKQPWAGLIVAGLKGIEVRTWPTSRRGPVLIHASKVPDERPEGWSHVVTPELHALTDLRGGILGLARLADCREYTNRTAFVSDGPHHLNDPSWFRPPRLFGHVFHDVQILPFCPYSGQTLYFSVKKLPKSLPATVTPAPSVKSRASRGDRPPPEGSME